MIFELHSEEYIKIMQVAEAAQKAEKEEHDPTKKISGELENLILRFWLTQGIQFFGLRTIYGNIHLTFQYCFRLFWTRKSEN